MMMTTTLLLITTTIITIHIFFALLCSFVFGQYKINCLNYRLTLYSSKFLSFLKDAVMYLISMLFTCALYPYLLRY